MLPNTSYNTSYTSTCLILVLMGSDELWIARKNSVSVRMNVIRVRNRVPPSYSEPIRTQIKNCHKLLLLESTTLLNLRSSEPRFGSERAWSARITRHPNRKRSLSEPNLSFKENRFSLIQAWICFDILLGLWKQSGHRNVSKLLPKTTQNDFVRSFSRSRCSNLEQRERQG